MRLTLRTMLAYMDDVLEPADAETLRQKIEESDFASGLAERIKGAVRKLRLDAPKLDGKGMGNDANTVAEYLDSSLPQDHVGEFERVCLESDKHLCEVAACHQVLTLVLGKAADVPPLLRERVYALGDPVRAAARTMDEEDAAVPRTKHGPPPVVKTNGRRVEQPPPPLEVPEYLRAGRQGSVWPFIGAAAAAFLLVLGALWLFGTFDGKNRIAALFIPSEPLAMNPDENEGKTEGEQTATDQTKTGENAGGAQKTTEGVAATETPAATGTNATEESTAAVAAATPAAVPPTAPAATERSPAESPDKIAATTTAAATAATSETTDVPPAPTPGGIAVTPKTPKAAPPAPPTPQPMEVGRYTSDKEILATLDPDDGLWYRKQAQEVLLAGEKLVALPLYRPQITLPSAVMLTFATEAAIQMEEPGEGNIPRVTVDYGRFIAATAGKAGAQVELNLAGIKGVVTLADADSRLAIKVVRWILPGLDPEAAEGIPVIEMYNINGRASWQQADKAKVEIPAMDVYVYYGDDPPEKHGPFHPPEWIETRSLPPIDREAATILERQIDLERPLSLSLQETMKTRHVKALAARCLAALDDFEPIIRELGDINQDAFWPREYDALRHAVLRSPQTAKKVRETLTLLREADAKDLYRLLWGYSQEQLEKGAGAQLVKFLEHEQPDVRALAYLNLVAITGQTSLYRPERSPAQNKSSITPWREKRDKGKIIYAGIPPQPLDSYKQVESVPAEPRPVAPPGATTPR